MKPLRLSLLLACCGTVVSTTISASEARWFGELQLHADRYTVSGNRDNSQYQFTGNHSWASLNLSGSQQLNPASRLSGDLGLSLNDSDYRLSGHDNNLEHFHLLWQNREYGMPFRLRVGDYYGFLSPRSLQRSLKGIMLELQPNGFGSIQQQSLLSFAGVSAPLYGDAKHYSLQNGQLVEQRQSFDQQAHAGFSWLGLDHYQNQWIANLLFNRNNADDSDLQQQLASFGWARNFALAGQQIEAEAEWAYLSDDSLDANGNRQNTDANGLFFQLQGHNKGPLRWRFNYALYDDGFAPLGSFVNEDSEEIQLRLSWRFDNGLLLRGRWQQLEDERSSNNPTNTDVVGISLNGSLWGNQIGLNAFRRQQTDLLGQQDQQDDVIDLNLFRRFSRQWTARANVEWLQRDDDSNNRDTDSLEVRLSVQRNFQLPQGFHFSIAPGVVHRQVDTKGADFDLDSEEISPALALRLSNKNHHLALDVRGESHRHDNDLAQDFDRSDTRFSWQWQQKQHLFGLEVQHHNQDPQNSEDTENWHFGLSYSYRFGSQSQATSTKSNTSNRVASGLLLHSLAPGSSLQQAAQRSGLVLAKAERGSDSYLLDYPMLDNIDERQRIGLQVVGNRVRQSGWLLEVPGHMNNSDIESLFNSVQEQLFRQLGRPDRQRERGRFNQFSEQQLRSRQFRRHYQWDYRTSRLLFDIVVGNDGQIRMQLLNRPLNKPAPSGRPAL